MFKSIIHFLVFFCISSASAYAGVKLYLFPRVYPASGDIRFDDVARIEGNQDEVNNIRKLVVPVEIYSDGFIDRKELYRILKSQNYNEVIIYGSASKISDIKVKIDNKQNNEYTVKSGDIVKLAVIKKGVRIEVQVTAASNGNVGEVIPVKLKNRKKVSGRIISSKLIELDL